MSRTVLDLLLAKYPTAKRQTLRRMLQAGRVRVGGAVVRRFTDPVGDAATVEVDERPVAKQPAGTGPRPGGLEIVFEDDDVLVVNKPPGLLTSSGPRETRPMLMSKVRTYVESGADPRARVGLIHRLDRDASGLLIFSKNDRAYRALKMQFLKHTVERVYLAAVRGKPFPPVGRIDTQLVERADGRVYSTDQHGKGDWALTDYEVLATEAGVSLVRVTLQTGRKHQIRVHLSEKGWPIVGDPMYGREDDNAPRLMLAAVKLSIDHPRTEERVTWNLPIPAEFPIKPPAA
jgi:23S rRNA pseudouridine1911/1915/1917 synthase